MKINMARITEDVMLPSNGVPYDTTSVTISNLTVAEEKMIYSSSSERVVDRILQSCIQSGVNIDDLVTNDKTFLMIRVRMLTYGNKYPIQLSCRHCGNTFDHVLDFNDIEIDELDSEFKLPRTDLPISGDTIEVKFLSGNDIKELDKSIDKRLTKFSNQDEGEVAYIYSLAYLISSVNGEALPVEQLYSYVSDMHARDSAVLRKITNDLSFGYPNILKAECTRCRGEVSFRLPNTADFFLAEYID